MNMTFREFPVATGTGSLTCLLAEPEQPAEQPALLLNFASDRTASLKDGPYDMPVRAFIAAGHRVAGFDLPCHGDRRVPGRPEGIAGFCAELMDGTDVFTRFVEESRVVIDVLIEDGLAAPGRIFVAGTSRGGYCALRLAAAEPRVAAVVAYAPVTDWRELVEFASVKHRPEVSALALTNWAGSLAGRDAWVAIGNQDERVGTACCLRFAEAVVAATSDNGLSAAGFTLHVVPEQGHSLSDRWRQVGADYLLDMA